MGGAWRHRGGPPGRPHRPMQPPAPGAAAARALCSGTDQVPPGRQPCLRPQLLHLTDYTFDHSTALKPAASQSLWGDNGCHTVLGGCVQYAACASMRCAARVRLGPCGWHAESPGKACFDPTQYVREQRERRRLVAARLHQGLPTAERRACISREARSALSVRSGELPPRCWRD